MEIRYAKNKILKAGFGEEKKRVKQNILTEDNVEKQ